VRFVDWAGVTAALLLLVVVVDGLMNLFARWRQERELRRRDMAHPDPDVWWFR